MEVGGLKGVGRELAVTVLRGFSVSLIWAGLQERMSLSKCVTGASLAEDHGPHVLPGTDSSP